MLNHYNHFHLLIINFIKSIIQEYLLNKSNALNIHLILILLIILNNFINFIHQLFSLNYYVLAEILF